MNRTLNDADHQLCITIAEDLISKGLPTREALGRCPCPNCLPQAGLRHYIDAGETDAARNMIAEMTRRAIPTNAQIVDAAARIAAIEGDTERASRIYFAGLRDLDNISEDWRHRFEEYGSHINIPQPPPDADPEIVAKALEVFPKAGIPITYYILNADSGQCGHAVCLNAAWHAVEMRQHDLATKLLDHATMCCEDNGLKKNHKCFDASIASCRARVHGLREEWNEAADLYDQAGDTNSAQAARTHTKDRHIIDDLIDGAASKNFRYAGVTLTRA